MIGNCVYLLILYPIFKIINGTTTIYTISIILIVIGIAGTILPVLPGFVA